MVWPCVLKDYQVGETLATVNDQINARGFCVSLGVQAGAFNRYEAFKRERFSLS